MECLACESNAENICLPYVFKSFSHYKLEKSTGECSCGLASNLRKNSFYYEFQSWKIGRRVYFWKTAKPKNGKYCVFFAWEDRFHSTSLLNNLRRQNLHTHWGRKWNFIFMLNSDANILTKTEAIKRNMRKRILTLHSEENASVLYPQFAQLFFKWSINQKNQRIVLHKRTNGEVRK